jgi:hypothetical protein
MVDGGKEQSIPHTQVNMIQRVDYRLGLGQGVAIGGGVGADGLSGSSTGAIDDWVFEPVGRLHTK